MEGKNSAYTKLYNRRRLLGLIRQEPRSRAELARKLGLTRAAISQITEELMGEGLVRESSAQPEFAGPGRTPTLLKLCEDTLYAVGISIRRSGCRIGVEDLSGKLLAARETVEARPEVLVEHVRLLLEEMAVPRERVLAIGVAAPGPLDVRQGVILNPPDFPGWENFPVAQLLEQEFGIPVVLENDASAAAVYHYMQPDFSERENFLLIFADCGVGSGVFSGGQLLRSADGFTCELGHTSIDFRGPRCSCGNRGCLELYAAPERLPLQFPGGHSWDSLMASPLRTEALEQEAEYLSAAIISFSNLVRIDAVLLGGRLRTVAQELLPMLERRVQGRSICGGRIVFRPAVEDGDSYVRSACAVVFCRYFEGKF